MQAMVCMQCMSSFARLSPFYLPYSLCNQIDVIEKARKKDLFTVQRPHYVKTFDGFKNRILSKNLSFNNDAIH